MVEDIPAADAVEEEVVLTGELYIIRSAYVTKILTMVVRHKFARREISNTKKVEFAIVAECTVM